MPYTIEKNKNLHVSKKHMDCDTEICNIAAPLPNKSFVMAIVGSSGSGKTVLALNLLSKRPKKNGLHTSYHKQFNHVIICSPSLASSSDKGNPLKDHIKDNPEKVFEEFDHEFLDFIEEFCTVAATEKENTLIMIDDSGALLKKAGLESRLSYFCQRRRHMRASVILIMQKFKQIPPNIRSSCITHLALFKCQNMKELESVWLELMHIPKKTLLDFSNFVWDKKHSFLFVDLSLQNSHKYEFYRNYDKINIEPYTKNDDSKLE